MKILVTGGAGYIGSVLVPKLLGHGYEVIVIDNFMYNQTSLLDCCHAKKLTIIRGDVRIKSLIKEQLKKVDAIFPLACLTGAPRCDLDPVGASTTNFEAIKTILKFRSKKQPIIYPSTQSVYGHQDLICMEETKVKPLSLYSKLKVKTESLLKEAGNFIVFRFATIFGISSRMRLDLLVNDFTYRAMTDKFVVLFEANFKRDYLYIVDVAKAFSYCLENFGKMKNQIYNVKLASSNLTKIELCEEIKKQIPDFVYEVSEIKKDPDRRNYMVSSEKIEKEDFFAKTSLDAGIAELIKGYQILRRNQFTNA